jgi:FkbM family methyltransferase
VIAALAVVACLAIVWLHVPAQVAQPQQQQQGSPLVDEPDVLVRPAGSLPAVTPSPTRETAPRVSPVAFHAQGNEDQALLVCMFEGMRDRRYLEMGALDGFYLSNTLFFAEQMGWTGILIEADSANYAVLATRRSWDTKIHTAICPEGQKEITFTGRGGAVSGVIDTMSVKFRNDYHKNVDPYTVPCRTLKGVLKELHVTNIDLFSLDVEGAELFTLQTMDWDVKVGVWVIELDGSDPSKDAKVRELIISKGYRPTLPLWNIRAYCTGDCPGNEVFLSPEMYERFKDRFDRGLCTVERMNQAHKIAKEG